MNNLRGKYQENAAAQVAAQRAARTKFRKLKLNQESAKQGLIRQESVGQSFAEGFKGSFRLAADVVRAVSRVGSKFIGHNDKRRKRESSAHNL